MNEHQPASVELVQATICLPDIALAQTQADVVAAIEKLPGVQSISVNGKELHVIYDPLQASEKEIEAATAGSGHPATSGEAERDSPFA